MTAARSLVELLERDDDAPLELVALLLVRDLRPRLDLDAAMQRLDALADGVRARVQRLDDAPTVAATLSTWLFDEQGFRGNEDDYYDPRNSDLAAVLDTRRGIPITLAVLLVAVARRCGIEAEGVGFPGHFLVRVGGPRGVLVDPFFRGRIVTPPVLDELARRTLGAPGLLRAEHLAPVAPRIVAARMLTNLKHIYERGREHAQALVVCDRLVDLTGAPEHRRDRGRHALALGAHTAAAEDLRAYLHARPGAPDVDAVRAELAAIASAPSRLQ